MHSSVIVGNAVQAIASSTKGWVVGHFMPPGIAWSCDFEIKIWHYDNQPDYGQKLFGGTEFIIVEAGTLKLELEIPDGRGGFIHNSVDLKGSARDWVIIPSNCKKRVFVTEAPSYGITVRWPSVPGMNVVV